MVSFSSVNRRQFLTTGKATDRKGIKNLTSHLAVYILVIG